MNFMILGLINLFFLPVILDRASRISKFLSRTRFFIRCESVFSDNSKSQIGGRAQSFGSFKRQRSLSIDGPCLRKEEVELVMGSLGFPCDPKEGSVRENLTPADLHDMFEEKAPCLDEVKAAFEVFDENRDGFIDAGELQRVLSSLGLEKRSGMESCRKMIQAVDQDGDGRICLDEFVQLTESSF